jgi:hypothetical protein
MPSYVAPSRSASRRFVTTPYRPDKDGVLQPERGIRTDNPRAVQTGCHLYSDSAGSHENNQMVVVQLRTCPVDRPEGAGRGLSACRLLDRGPLRDPRPLPGVHRRPGGQGRARGDVGHPGARSRRRWHRGRHGGPGAALMRTAASSAALRRPGGQPCHEGLHPRDDGPQVVGGPHDRRTASSQEEDRHASVPRRACRAPTSP